MQFLDLQYCQRFIVNLSKQTGLHPHVGQQISANNKSQGVKKKQRRNYGISYNVANKQKSKVWA